MREYLNGPVVGSCPVCDSSAAIKLWQATSSEAAQHYVLNTQDSNRNLELAEHLQELWGQSFVEVLTCSDCTFTYSYPYVAGGEKFYSLAYSKPGYPVWRWEFDLSLSMISNRKSGNISLLEVGSGDGSFLRKVLQNGVKASQILSTEFSITGRAKIERDGIEVLPIDVRDIDEAKYKNKFDVICMFQVMEHLDRLDELYGKLSRLLSDNGEVYISVPNGKGITFNELNGALLDMPPNHVGRWNEKCVRKLAEKNGFSVVDFQVESPSFMDMAKQIIIYRYHKRSQRMGSVENLSQKLGSGLVFRLVRVLLASWNTLLAIPTILRMNSSDMGSIWWKMQKSN